MSSGYLGRWSWKKKRLEKEGEAPGRAILPIFRVAHDPWKVNK